jgi:hypothetical protein
MEPGMALALAALGVEAVLACRLFLLTLARRQECVTLIAERGADAALEPVERERRRLSSRRYKRCLAGAVEELARPQPPGARALTARPPIAARVVDPVRPWLHEIAGALGHDDVSVRGVARLELLITSPMSALYGADPDQLRREVGRVRYLLWS